MIVAICVLIILSVILGAMWADERTKRIAAERRRR